jgi:NDP-sugar pyrophosphorylase family protein
MLFAAGLGTRLAPLTDRLPKALVPVAGVAMLERVARALVFAGADRLIINTHRFADQIQAFVAEHANFGVEVCYSAEPVQPLETGGGLRHARHLFRGASPAFLHNTDVLTDFPLANLYAGHMARRPLATLAVNERAASRYLYFDDLGLCGRVDTRSGEERRVRPVIGELRRLAFCGIHVVEPTLPEMLEGDGAFSIIDAYLGLAAAGHRIEPYAMDDWLWLDIGSPQRLAAAERILAGSDNESG